ncbi:Rad52/Rad22 family DNA repair protein [Sulfurovum riftiae]|uniref:DNA repair protein Rad52 n=1 Tax=Sulfurovum riftiae TaxID=1630136 RepID=A0A151CDH5_9BACT|nr:Rad52/Rad22 family DNA repair protein [Sulfurovum riftiae]KYJ85582.1 DNA repair protein Rad52 [Sulfurovum riftiae]
MFVDKQIQVLKHDIEPSRIKSRTKGNINLAYLEGFDLIDTANKIFGHGNWSYSISSLEQVSQETNSNQNVVICYKAVLKLSVYSLDHSKHILKEDVGFGTGIAKTLADAHEGAAKEAVTDALKRSMRSFGNQFGNSLYDKSRNHQVKPQLQSSPSPSQPQVQQQPPQAQYEFSSLYNLGLQVLEQGNNLIVVGEDIFNKKDSIKACGFRWDASRKVWYLPKQNREAA